MTNVLSKLRQTILLPDWSFGYNCYEVGHTWTPHCSDAALDLGLTVFTQGLKMYSGLYILSHFVFSKNRSLDAQSINTILESSLRSSAFLGFNAMTMLLGFCSVRKVTGKFYYTLCASLPALVGSLLAIFIEKASRRSALAFYVANIASECVWNIAASRGVVKSLPGGHVALFTLSISVLLFLIKKKGHGSDPVSLALRFLMGPEEAKMKKNGELRKKQVQEINKSKEGEGNRSTGISSSLESYKPDVRELQMKKEAEDGLEKKEGENGRKNTRMNGKGKKENGKLLPAFLSSWSLPSWFARQPNPLLWAFHGVGLMVPRHSCCNHKSDCDEYVTSGFCKSLLAGWILQSGLNCVLKFGHLVKHPRDITSNFTSSRSLKFGLFLASFCGIYKAVNCYLRHRNGTNSDHHALIAGLMAGPAMAISPNFTITMYVTWKAIEAVFFSAVDMKMVPFPNEILAFLYASSVAVIFYTGVLEPSMLRGSYMKFIDKVTEHKLHLINRNLLDIFGTGASVGYEEYFPDLNPQLCSNFFLETIYVWML